MARPLRVPSVPEIRSRSKTSHRGKAEKSSPLQIADPGSGLVLRYIESTFWEVPSHGIIVEFGFGDF